LQVLISKLPSLWRVADLNVACAHRSTAPHRTPAAATDLDIIEPNPIAQINKAAAQRAAFEMLGLAHWWPADLPADHGAAWTWLVHWHDHGHGHHLKKIQARIAPSLISYGARRTSGRAAIVISYRHGERLCQTDRTARATAAHHRWRKNGISRTCLFPVSTPETN
jgi:hypothetical protein